MEVTRSNPFDGSFSSWSESSSESFGIENNENKETIEFKNRVKQEKYHELKRSIKIVKEIDSRIIKLCSHSLYDEYEGLNADLSLENKNKSMQYIYEYQKNYIMCDMKSKMNNHYFNDAIDLNFQNTSKSLFDESRYHKSSLNCKSAPTSKLKIKQAMINCPEPFMISDFEKMEDSDLKFECICNLFDTEATEILPNLFLGPADSQGSFDLVILLTSKKNLKNGKYNKIYQFPENEGKVDIFSISSNPKHLQKAIHLMETVQNKKKKILVCCKRGKDLCALVLCAFLMKKYDVKAEEAYKYLNYCRPYLTLDTILEDIQPYKDFLETFFHGKETSLQEDCMIS